MGQTNAKLRELEAKIDILFKELKELKVSRSTLVSKALELPKSITKTVSDEIRRDYDAINHAIQGLDRTALDFGSKKHALQELKKDVPVVYSLPKDLQRSIIQELNKILGKNTSN